MNKNGGLAFFEIKKKGDQVHVRFNLLVDILLAKGKIEGKVELSTHMTPLLQAQSHA